MKSELKSRIVIFVTIAALAAAVAIVGVVAVAGADAPVKLPSLTAPQLLAKMTQARGNVPAISGVASWTNRLFGIADVADLSFAHMPAQNPLLAGGSGRIWLSRDGVRLESQGAGGDQVAVVGTDAHEAWTYEYATDVARHIVFKGAPAGGEVLQPPTSPPAVNPLVIAALLERLATLGTVSVDGQTTVAGRDAYQLVFTPAATDTALGAVKVAVDGETFVPLRVQVFGKGDTEAVLRLGFDSVSFAPIDPRLFAFTPPATATVITETLDAGALRDRMAVHGQEYRDEATSEAKRAQGGRTPGKAAPDIKELRDAVLTQEQARKQAPFALVAGHSPARPFHGAFVVKDGALLGALGAPLSGLAGPASAGTDGGSAPAGPAVVQVYGESLGAIWLVQMPATDDVAGQLDQMPELFDGVDVAGREAAAVTTPLGGIVLWRQGGTIVAALGMVSAADLKAFAGSVH